MAVSIENLSFTALNLHTASRSHKSLCGIGILVVENGQKVFMKYILVRPTTKSFEYEKYGYFRKEDVLRAKTLSQLWSELSPHIANRNVVFYDIEKAKKILHDSLKANGISMPKFNALDIMDMFDDKQSSYSFSAMASTVGFDDDFQNGDVYDNLRLYRACIEYGAKHNNKALQETFNFRLPPTMAASDVSLTKPKGKSWREKIDEQNRANEARRARMTPEEREAEDRFARKFWAFVSVVFVLFVLWYVIR